jgi:hypothetical protein
MKVRENFIYFVYMNHSERRGRGRGEERGREVMQEKGKEGER